MKWFLVLLSMLAYAYVSTQDFEDNKKAHEIYQEK
jgi:hypothetical protein